MHTEEQARKLWCPEKGVNNPDGDRCIASGCMMWRWVKVGLDEAAPKTGFCGLAGRP